MKVDNVDKFHNMVRRVDSPDAHDSEDDNSEEAKAEMAPILSLPGEPAATVEYINAAHGPVDIMDVKHKQSAFIRLESDDPVTSAEAVLDASAIASYAPSVGTCFMQVQPQHHQLHQLHSHQAQTVSTQDVNQLINIISSGDLLSNLTPLNSTDITVATNAGAYAVVQSGDPLDVSELAAAYHISPAMVESLLSGS